MLPKLFQETRREETLPNSFCETSIIIIPKRNKDVTRKENYRSISFMNIDANILNKVLANRIQQHVKKIIHHLQASFIPGIQEWFNISKSISAYKQRQGQNPHYLLSRCRKIPVTKCNTLS
jgi:hypothetical protein